jgi:starch synthase
MQIAVLGMGEKHIEDALRALQERYPFRFAINVGYDERSAHLLHAGADILLHGSRFEPFGLTPIYSILYGTIPVASRIGGLADTIKDAPLAEGAPIGDATGVLFDGDTVDAMVAAVERAVSLYRNPQAWTAMQKNGMTTNFGWESSAAKYIELYRSLAPVAPVTAPIVTRRTFEAAIGEAPVIAPALVSERKRA